MFNHVGSALNESTSESSWKDGIRNLFWCKIIWNPGIDFSWYPFSRSFFKTPCPMHSLPTILGAGAQGWRTTLGPRSLRKKCSGRWGSGSVIELPAPAEGPSPAPSFLVLILFFPISLFLIFFLFYFLSSCLPFPFHFLHYYSCLTTADKHWETQCWNLLVKGSLLVSLVINHHL